jgi:hypothetical protein
MSSSQIIAIYVLLLYTFLAPLVLFGIFVLFDVLGRTSSEKQPTGIVPSFSKKDPAVWTSRDIAEFRNRI